MSAKSASFTIKSKTIRRRAGAFSAELLRAQRLPAADLEALQQRRFASIARFAMESTTFYRDLYRDAGISAQDLADPASHSSLPIIDRTIVKEHTDGFWSKEALPKYVRDARTGGSTGQPLRTGVDNRVPTLALAWRMYSWWGVRPWDNLARVGRWSMGRSDLLKNTLQWWPSQHTYVDAGMLNRDTMAAFMRAVIKTRPALIEGYVGALLELSDYVADAGIEFPPPVAIGSTAAPLTESSRRRIEAVLQAPVYDEYRGSEVQWMAGECRQRSGLHIFADLRRIEVVDGDGRLLPPGEVGDLVITDYSNRVFPIIRYRNGDRGMLIDGSCSCGVTLPLMAPPQGRTADMLRLPDGTVLAHRVMAMFSEHPEAVSLFQVHQREDYSITLRVVPGPDPQYRQRVEEVAAALKSRVAGQVPVLVEYVDEIPMPRGKIQYVISEVPAPHSAPSSQPAAE